MRKTIRFKTALLFFSMFFLLNACNEPAPSAADCSKLKNGFFRYKFRIGDKLSHYLIARKDSIQVETNLDEGEVARYRIKWLDPCTYELQFQSSSLSLTSKEIAARRSIVLKTEIQKVTDRYYIFKSSSRQFSNSFHDTIWIGRD